jgi:hypothetical protein
MMSWKPKFEQRRQRKQERETELLFVVGLKPHRSRPHQKSSRHWM